MTAPRSTTTAAAPWQQFICRVCGLIYDERLGDADSGLKAGTRWDEIPEDWACPICGVGKADFEPYVPPQAVIARRAGASPRPTRGDDGVVIVGAGRAGWAVAQALRDQGYSGALTLVSACAADVYDKPQLSVAVARGLDPTALVRESAALAAARLEVRLRCHTHAVAIDAGAKRLRTTRGTLRWQRLVLAQGAEPALPAVLPAALVWRINDLAAYQRLRAALADRPQHVAIVGAGLVGCELANDLALAGHAITLLDVQPWPLAAQVPAAASQRLLQAWQTLPIEFRGGVQVAGVERLAGAAPGAPALQLNLKDCAALQVDQVIAATGLRAAGRLAATAGLAFDSAAGGIAVSVDSCATSVPGIHALGDCAVVDGQASRFIEPIARQARAIAHHIMHGTGIAPEPAARPVLRVKTSGMPITVTGLPQVSLATAGAWHTETDTAQELRLVRRGAQGEAQATLVARVTGP